MTVEVEKLKASIERIFLHLQQRGVSSIEIEEDFYWNIAAEEAYDPMKTPSELDLGQLSEDWQKLVSIANGDAAIGYGLVWASSILRRIGELQVG